MKKENKKEHLEDKIIKHGVVVFVLMYSIYALFAFAQGNINALDWNIEIRSACVGIISILVVYYFLFFLDFKN